MKKLAIITSHPIQYRLRAWGQRSLEIVSRYSYEQTTAGLQQALASLDGARAAA